VPTAVADSLAGTLIVLPLESPCLPPLRLAGLAFVSSCIYMGGMVLNDLVDLQRDRSVHPGRPLPSGKLRPTEAWRYLRLLLLAALGVSLLLGTNVLGMALALVALVAAYNLIAKCWRLPGALAMGACRSFNMMLGMSAAGASLAFPSGAAWAPPLILGGYVAGITLVSTFEDRLPGASRWVAVLLRGIIPLDAGLVLLQGRPLAALGVLALLPLALGLRRWLPRHE
jgi:4-hydroxybenzoate polyprenyltransferase